MPPIYDWWFLTSASFSKDAGKMLENFVFLGLRRKFREIFYFKEKNECDFVLEEKDKVTAAIQVCYDFNEENKGREISGLLAALKAFGLRDGLVLTYNQDDEFMIEGKQIIVKPVWKWLLK